jgi:hypothetical protein
MFQKLVILMLIALLALLAIAHIGAFIEQNNSNLCDKASRLQEEQEFLSLNRVVILVAQQTAFEQESPIEGLEGLYPQVRLISGATVSGIYLEDMDVVITIDPHWATLSHNTENINVTFVEFTGTRTTKFAYTENPEGIFEVLEAYGINCR